MTLSFTGIPTACLLPTPTPRPGENVQSQKDMRLTMTLM